MKYLPDGYGKISQCITTTKHSKAKTVCIFLGIYCIIELICETMGLNICNGTAVINCIKESLYSRLVILYFILFGEKVNLYLFHLYLLL